MNKIIKQCGVTLIELMITVAILAIIVAFAIPSYTDRVRRANRVDATATLLAITAAQERFYLKNDSYTLLLSDLQIEETESQLYSLELEALPNGGYTAKATPIQNTSQALDADCTSFSIDHTGRRTATGAGPDASNLCW